MKAAQGYEVVIGKRREKGIEIWVAQVHFIPGGTYFETTAFSGPGLVSILTHKKVLVFPKAA